MLDSLSPSRRTFLASATLGAAGVTLAPLAAASSKTNDRAVILYWLAGGPSHIDTFDPKPDAPAEVRGPFRAMPTRVPGMRITEPMPRLAALADRFTLIRSLHHGHSVHDDGSHWVQTGYPQLAARAVGQQFPAQGSVAAALRGPVRSGMPAYVCIPQAYSSPLGFYQKAAFLGTRFDPLNSGGEPDYRGVTRAEFDLAPGMTVDQLHARRGLRDQLDAAVRGLADDPAGQRLAVAYERAFDLASSPAVRAAFDADREPSVLRDRYGRHPWGKAALLARRLVEAGVRCVTINHYHADIDWWDDHFVIEKNLRRRLPLFDQALGTLLDDLHVRGLSERVLVVAVGEFGRGPVIDKAAGRSHWPRAFSALVSGGGTRGGQIIGATTSNGGEPRERPVTPAELTASIYRVLGIDPEAFIRDRQNRPLRVSEGEPIRELF